MKPRNPKLWETIVCPTCGTSFVALVSEKRRFCSRPCIRRSPEERAVISSSLSGQVKSQETKQKMRESKLGNNFGVGRRSSEVCARMSASRKVLWKDSEYRKRVADSLNISPNRPEELLFKEFEHHFPGQWLYTGGGQRVLWTRDRRFIRPDFMHVSEPLVIELFGEHWHIPDEVESREKLFESLGYQALIIWCDELSSIDQVVRKVKDLMNR